ncbi:MAG: hypothetical protein RL757_2793 [Bacteroidota bacterium]|jgi:uncharacterized protein (TIGR02453 family)
MLSQNYSQFFRDLAQQNERDWFHANKKRYETDAKQPFLELVGIIIEKLQQSTEPDWTVDAKQCLFRINRDIRFSTDKRPYKEHLSASVGKFGTKDKTLPGHYLQMEGEKAFLAGGAYFFEEKEMLKRVRYYIMDNHETFAELLAAPDFQKYWGVVVGEKNKRLPPEFADFFDVQPLIANKQFYWTKDILPADAAQFKSLEDWANHIVAYFQAAKPMNDFLTEAMFS